MKVNLKPPYRYPTLFALALFLLSNTLFAQGLIFQPSSTEAAQLNPEQQALYQKATNTAVYSSAELIDIAPLDEVIGNRNLRINTPEGDLHLNIKTIEYVSEDNYYLYAEKEVTHSRNDLGRASLMLRSQDGIKFGNFRHRSHTYQIEDLGDGQNIIMEEVHNISYEDFPRDEHISVKGDASEAPPTSGPGSRSNCDVRVLFLYTQAAANLVINAQNTAQQHVDQVNQALANSAISASNLRFELAGAETLTTVSEVGQTATQVLLDVRSDPTAQARRNANDADLVCLITDNGVGNFGTTAGVAFVGFNGAPAADGNAYSMIRLFASLGDQLFAHEGGHNMGGNHEAADNNQTNFHKAHDWTWTTGWWFWRRTNRRQTIMWSTINNDDQTLNYSNPNVNHSSGNATGTADANNAQILRNNACTVANYRTAASNLIVGINGPELACPLETVCWSANVSGAPGPYTYTWSWTTNGSSYTTFGSGSSACLNMFNFSAPQLITIRLEVNIPSDPNPTFAFKDLDLVVPSNGQIICALKQGDPTIGEELIGAENTLLIVPNPASDRAEIRLNLAQDGDATVGLYNLTGQQVLEVIQGKYEAGNHNFNLDAANLANGIYILRAETNGERLVQRFVVNH